jgi:non-heme chloroperoxidase
MSILTTVGDGTRIFYKDWGAGPPIVFSHGWPLSSDAWDPQLVYFGERGHRVIAHDRRGHGHSGQTWTGNDMNTYADDLAELLEVLDVRGATLVGHSTGGGEVVRYIGRHGARRVSRIVLVSAVPPLMVRSTANPDGVPRDTFDAIRSALVHDRSQFLRDFALPFYGFNRKGAWTSQGLVEQFWRLGMQAGIKSVLDCVAAFSETDFHEDLRKIDVPTLIVHGDDDQIVPVAISALKTARLVRGATLKVMPGAPHGLVTTRHEELNAEILAFIRAEAPYATTGAPPPAA